jgi:hypothetical protein
MPALPHTEGLFLPSRFWRYCNLGAMVIHSHSKGRPCFEGRPPSNFRKEHSEGEDTRS